VKQKMFELLFS